MEGDSDEYDGEYGEMIREKIAEQVDKQLYKSMKEYARKKKEEEEEEQEAEKRKKMTMSKEGKDGVNQQNRNKIE